MLPVMFYPRDPWTSWIMLDRAKIKRGAWYQEPTPRDSRIAYSRGAAGEAHFIQPLSQLNS